MMGTALIVFREVLEAALIISIVLAATRGVARRGRHVAYGIGAGVLGAALIAAFSSVIAELGEGMGQELLNASILFSAVILLGWHNVWMKRHGRELAQKMSSMGKAVAEGSTPLHVLSIVVALAVLREGAEIVCSCTALRRGAWLTVRRCSPAALLGWCLECLSARCSMEGWSGFPSDTCSR